MNIKSKLKYYRVFFLMLIGIGAVAGINAQEADWMPFIREVVVNHNDSLVRAHILVQPSEVEVDNVLMYYWYKQQNIYHNMGGFAGDLLHGEYLVFDKDKNLITKGYYKQGLRHGIWKYWNAEGKLRFSLEYNEGLIDGEYLIFNSDGTLEEEREYKDGILQEKKSGSAESDSTKTGLRIWKSIATPESDTTQTDVR